MKKVMFIALFFMCLLVTGKVHAAYYNVLNEHSAFPENIKIYNGDVKQGTFLDGFRNSETGDFVLFDNNYKVYQYNGSTLNQISSFNRGFLGYNAKIKHDQLGNYFNYAGNIYDGGNLNQIPFRNSYQEDNMLVYDKYPSETNKNELLLIEGNGHLNTSTLIVEHREGDQWVEQSRQLLSDKDSYATNLIYSRDGKEIYIFYPTKLLVLDSESKEIMSTHQLKDYPTLKIYQQTLDPSGNFLYMVAQSESPDINQSAAKIYQYDIKNNFQLVREYKLPMYHITNSFNDPEFPDPSITFTPSGEYMLINAEEFHDLTTRFTYVLNTSDFSIKLRMPIGVHENLDKDDKYFYFNRSIIDGTKFESYLDHLNLESNPFYFPLDVRPLTNVSGSLKGKTLPGSKISLLSDDQEHFFTNQLVSKDGTFEIDNSQGIKKSDYTLFVQLPDGNMYTQRIHVQQLGRDIKMEVNSVDDLTRTVSGYTEPDIKVQAYLPSIFPYGPSVQSTRSDASGYFHMQVPYLHGGELVRLSFDYLFSKNVTVKDLRAPILLLDPITMDSLSLKGKTDPYQVVKLYNGDKLLTTKRADANGNISVYLMDTYNNKKYDVTHLTVQAGELLTTRKSVTIDQPGSVDMTPPNATFNLSTSKWTNQDVQVTIHGTDQNGEINSITLPDGNKVFTDTAVFTVLKSGTYTFQIEDAAGNTVNRSIKISNIDKTSPLVNCILNTQKTTNKNVLITLQASDGSGIKSIATPAKSYDNVSHVTYTVTKNGTYLFKIRDGAGNEVRKTITINNIDKTAPKQPAVGKVTTKTTIVKGKGEAGATVYIYRDKIQLGKSTINRNGSFNVSIPKQGKGKIIKVYVQDAAGNKSVSYQVKVR